MKGLLIKDLLTLRRYGKIMIGAVAFMLAASFFLEDFSFVSAMVVVFGATLPITVFSYDTLAHWDGYSLTLPVSRRQLVTSKYLLGLMLSTAGFVLSALINLAGEGPDPQRLWILLPLIFLAGSVLYLSILLPLVYQFGAEKSRTISMIFFIVIFGGCMLLGKLAQQQGGLPRPPAWLANALPALLAILAVGTFVLSYWIAQGIYEKKEL